MKLLLSFILGAIHCSQQSVKQAAAFDIDEYLDQRLTCRQQCFKDFWLQTVKCALNDDYDDEQTEICYDQAVQEWWYGCWGDQCGTNLPEGICYEKCTPALLEEVEKCDDALANGEITQNEHYLCIMGPGGPSDTWDLCTASCICDQPWCDCTPPEDQTKDFYPTLKEISFTCYVRPDEDIPLPV